MRVQQCSRALGLAATCAAVVFAVAFIVARITSAPELAQGKSWYISSAYANEPKSGLVHGAQDFFFHTDSDPEPWITIDIGSHTIREVVVTNRQGCCQERAAPLVIEVSTDATTWRPVAERRSSFDVWDAKFPAIDTRYVRIRAEHATYLHLANVEIY